MTPRLARTLAIGALGGAALYVSSALRITGDFTPFVGGDDQPAIAAVSRALADGEPARHILLRVGGSNLETALEASHRLEARLLTHPEILSVRSGPPPGLREAFLDLYSPRSLLFLSDRPHQEFAETISQRGLGAAARRLRQRLAGPSGLWIAQLAPSDPLLSLHDAVDRLRELQMGSLQITGGRFVTQDGRWAVLFVTTRHSPFDLARQSPLQDFIAASLADLDRIFNGSLRLEQASLHRFAVASARRARRDASLLTAASAVGMSVTFLLILGSFRLLLVALVPVAAGALIGCTATLLAFGEVHWLTLVFGSTLIGVCIDYPIHLISHHVLLAVREPFESLRRVWPALCMGAATTVGGFAILTLSTFPGIREMGFFSGTGVLGGLLATRWLVPALLSERASAGPLGRRLFFVLASRRFHPRAAMLLVATCAILCLLGLTRLTWQDDVYALNVSIDPAWLVEEARVRETVSGVDVGRVVIAIGKTDEEALRNNDAVALRLAEARRANELTGFRSLHALLWSESLQKRNWDAIVASEGLADSLDAALVQEGFRKEVFQPFRRSLAGRPPAPLRWRDLAMSPLASVVQPFRIEVGDKVAILTFLRGTRDLRALAARLADLEGVHVLDQREILRAGYRRYRQRTVPLVGAGVLVIAVIAAIRYRRPRLALIAVAPAVLAAGTTLSLLTWFGFALNLVHLLGVLLVMGFGVDYAIFLLEGRGNSDEKGATLVALVAACISTVFSFGLLALSGFPVLRALGLSIGTGVLLSLILAPALLGLLQGERAS